jgi:transposase
MPQSHPPYPAEYRRRIVELARAGRSVNELAREFEPSASAIGDWLKQAGLDEGLRRENRVLREEREILAKAAAWLAPETGTAPSRRSNA